MVKLAAFCFQHPSFILPFQVHVYFHEIFIQTFIRDFVGKLRCLVSADCVAVKLEMASEAQLVCI